jgi:leader peptidase (prepilin peptidase) / N-methyltransferase
MPKEVMLVYIVAYLLVFVVGVVIGSFINVVICRLPDGRSFVHGRSACPACGHQLAARDLVPIFSWLILRRRCRYCGTTIPARYPLVELIGGALACATVAVYGFTGTAVAVFALLAGLLACAFIDLDTMTIPNGLVLYLVLPAAALVFLLPSVSLLSHGIGFFVVSLPLFLIALLFGGFGMGDVKLMAICGLALGWQLALLAFLIGLVLGAVYAIYLLLARHATRRTAFAFGPYLCLGVATALLAGPPLVRWYGGLLF